MRHNKLVLEIAIQVLIVLNIVAFTVETIPDLAPEVYVFLRWFEIFTVGIFTVEYVIRLIISRPRLAYAKSFFGVIDLLAILPFYLSLGFDLRSIRALRLFRIFRVLKLIRYHSALQRYRLAFSKVKDELVIFSFAAAILIFLSSVGIYYCEKSEQPETFGSIPDCIWWSIVTLTTVGMATLIP